MNLEEYRINKDLSYSELSDLLGLKKTTTFNICKELVKSISLTTATLIVERTGKEVGYLDLQWGTN